MKRVRIPLKLPELTPSANRRQKADIFSSRGSHKFKRFYVRELPRLPGLAPRGAFCVGIRTIRCAIGLGGMGVKRREGDSITPLGRYAIVSWLLRFERWNYSRAGCYSISKTKAWCDDPQSFSYNRPVSLPFRFRTETLWRHDHLYDLIGVIDFNARPRVLGKGSAIFLHAAQADYSPTAGCIALAPDDLRKIQTLSNARPQIVVGNVF